MDRKNLFFMVRWDYFKRQVLFSFSERVEIAGYR
jgi:hypothetical protein